ncbi:galactose oxidase-like domain-containing protein [Amnibacterium endophyticum]|uniref:Galactose oxidase-like domain-containing protein n=1 Tax=Amnibacterium endophyticum TaxID=2109337 RepID=A0ABW4LBQ5_9MICO
MAHEMMDPAAHGGMLMPTGASCTAFRPALSTKGWSIAATSAVKGHLASAALRPSTRSWWQSKSSRQGRPFKTQTLTLRTRSPKIVSGLRYLPAAKRGAIGRFEVRVSRDGRRYGGVVAKGRWERNSMTKQVAWSPKRVRSVKVTIRSVSPARSRSVTAASIRLLGAPKAVAAPATSVPAAAPAAPPSDTSTTAAPVPASSAPTAPVPTVQGDPSVVGRWGPTIAFPLVPVAAAAIPGNRLVVWAADEDLNFGQTGAAATQTAVVDLTTGAVSATRVSNTGHNMFCPGISMLADGRILVTGGISNTETSIYDPTTDRWSAGPRMNIERGYQGQTTLSDGRAFTVGGSWSGPIGGKVGEVYTPGGAWRTLPGVPAEPMLTADNGGVYRSDNHAWLIASSGGTVLQAGPSKQMNWISTSGDGAVSPAGSRGDAGDQMNGNAVLFDVGKVLTVGGATSYQDVDATGAASVLDLTGGYGRPVSVERTGSLAHPRSYANSVVLPDGSVFTVGGMQHPVPFSDAGSVLTPELWNPASGAWAEMADAAEPRNYHSVATLLPDGTVFSGGGGLCGSGCATNHPTGQIFSPPYLFDADGTPAARPIITGVPAAVRPGQTITVTTGTTASSFVLIRAGASTHSVDNDQRRVPLTVSSRSGSAVTLAVPSDTGVVLPGRYMLFAVTDRGVPSISAPVSVSLGE